jgi:hypothetical protein
LGRSAKGKKNVCGAGRNPSELFNVNFNANLSLFLKLSNCASVGEKTLTLSSSVKIRNVFEIHKRVPRCLCYVTYEYKCFFIYISAVFGTRVDKSVEITNKMQPCNRIYYSKIY